MPLKALHPLLEDGTVGDEVFQPWKKVFIFKFLSTDFGTTSIYILLIISGGFCWHL